MTHIGCRIEKRLVVLEFLVELREVKHLIFDSLKNNSLAIYTIINRYYDAYQQNDISVL